MKPTKPIEPGDAWLSASRAAAYLGVSRSTLYRWRMTGVITAAGATAGGDARFLRSELDAWVINNQRSGDGGQ